MSRIYLAQCPCSPQTHGLYLICHLAMASFPLFFGFAPSTNTNRGGEINVIQKPGWCRRKRWTTNLINFFTSRFLHILFPSPDVWWSEIAAWGRPAFSPPLPRGSSPRIMYPQVSYLPPRVAHLGMLKYWWQSSWATTYSPRIIYPQVSLLLPRGLCANRLIAIQRTEK